MHLGNQRGKLGKDRWDACGSIGRHSFLVTGTSTKWTQLPKKKKNKNKSLKSSFPYWNILPFSCTDENKWPWLLQHFIWHHRIPCGFFPFLKLITKEEELHMARQSWINSWHLSFKKIDPFQKMGKGLSLLVRIENIVNDDKDPGIHPLLMYQ